MQEVKRINMSIDEARQEKWEAGVKEHGRIISNDPLEELWDEILDGINYVRQLELDPRVPCNNGSFANLRAAYGGLITAAAAVQLLKEDFGGKEFESCEGTFR